MRLYLDNISVSFGENEVLKNVSFEVNSKDKVAIVGRNGCGKTTLLRVITGEQEIDTDVKNSATIQKSGKFQIGQIKQVAFENDQETFENEILKAYSEVLEIKRKLSEIEKSMQVNCLQEDIIRHDELLTKYDLMGGFTYLKEYNTAIKKFGFVEEDKVKKLCEFSGGQRTKIALIKLLLSKPDLLILDEPTNHLDITSIEWLEEYLVNYPKAVIVVSHDRAFLDRFVNVVYEIERHKIKKYVGNYSQFVKTKELNYEKEVKEYREHTEEKARLQALADRFRYKATKAKMAQSKLKQIERMGEMDAPEGANTKVFSFNTNPKIESGEEVLFAQNLEIGYDKVLTRLNFRILKGDRVGVIGGNGLGKSTLLKTIVGKIPPLGGKIKFGINVDVGYFDQQSATKTTADESILDNFLKEFPEEDTQNARTILGMFCFSQDDVFKNLKDLSGGERVRLELCKILKKQPNFLILDEPTNHMDIVGKEALEKMLLYYKGTILFVSHDRYFVNKLANNLIVFDEDNPRFLKDTNYKEYERLLQKKSAEVKSKGDNKTIINVGEKVNSENKNLYLLNKEKNRNQVKSRKLEIKIQELENEIKELREKLERPEICSDYIKLMEIQEVIDEKSVELEKLMEEWMTIN